MAKSYLDNVDTEQVTKLLNNTDTNATYFTSITDNVVKSYSEQLDKILEKIRQTLATNETEMSMEQLEKYMLELSNCLYFIGEKLEYVGIKMDVSRAAQKEVYNNAYLDNDIEKFDDSGKKIKPTKDANIAVAEEKSKYENIVTSIYERTYKVIKFKIDAGYEMLSTLKKILSRRITEFEASTRTQPVSSNNF